MYQNTGAAPEAARLEDYLRAMQRHKWVVLAFTLLGLAMAFLFTSSQTPSYTAIATVRVAPTPVDATNDNNLVEPILETEAEVITSNATANDVIEALGVDTTPGALLENLEVEFLPDSNVLDIAYTSTNRENATTTANAFATSYVNAREGAAVAFYENTIASSNAQAEVISAEISDLQSQYDSYNAARQTAALGNDQAEIARIDGERSVLQTQINTLSGELRNVNADSRAAQTNLDTRSPAAEVLRNATPPSSPDGIPRNMMLAAGLFLGGILGFVTAFLLERLDTTARDSEDVALALGSTVMGSIPTLGLGHRSGPNSLIMLTSGGSSRVAAAREAFRRLRSSIQFLNTSSSVSSLIVTSSSPTEGKSLTSANLSIALAQNGARTVLVSGDLRRPSLERMFGMQGPRPGLSEYLAASAELNAEKVPGIDNLWLIRAGRPPANPGELLNSDRFEQMIKELERESVEYIVVDTPPVLSTADAVSAARNVDGVIVVVDTERTETADLLQVRADLERSGSKLLGAVMNRQKFERAGIFKRDKYAYYSADARRGTG